MGCSLPDSVPDTPVWDANSVTDPETVGWGYYVCVSGVTAPLVLNHGCVREETVTPWEQKEAQGEITEETDSKNFLRQQSWAAFLTSEHKQWNLQATHLQPPTR